MMFWDMDGVVADFYGRIVRQLGLSDEEGIEFFRRFRAGDPEAKAMKDEIDRKPGFYFGLEMFQAAHDVVIKLGRMPGFQVMFGTSGDARFPESIKEKAEWLLEKFGLEFGHIISRDKTLYSVHDYEARLARDGTPVFFNRVLNVLLDDRRQSKGRMEYKGPSPAAGTRTRSGARSLWPTSSSATRMSRCRCAT